MWTTTLRSGIALCVVPFTGWPPDALTFLSELEANNDRDWFKAGRARYEAALMAPARALGEELGAYGTPKLFRPFNDQRFHARPPIKEHVGLALMSPSGGGYVELSLDGLLVAAGLYDPAPDQIARLRAAIDDDRRAAGLTRAVGRAERAGLVIAAPELKRVPRGYDAEHPRAALLRHKRVLASVRWELEPWLHTPECGTRITAALEATRPLVRWLHEHVGPSTRAARR